MKTSIFIAVILVAGAIAGTIYGLVNLVLVEPYLDTAISIENQHLFNSGKEQNTPDFWAKYYSYSAWQKGGQIIAGSIFGLPMGALFGLVFGLIKNWLPRKNPITKSLFLALMMWTSLYMIPFVKFPANLPSSEGSETIMLRQTLYLTMLITSSIGALGFFVFYRKTGKKFISVIGYVGLVAVAFFIIPENPDSPQLDSQLILFRFATITAMTAFWISLALIFGVLWIKLNLDKIYEIK